MLCPTGFETCETCKRFAAEIQGAPINLGDGACGTL